NETAKDLWDALERQMSGSSMVNKIGKLQFCMSMRHSKLMKESRYKKKAIVITSYPLALVAEKMNVSKQKEKVVLSLDSERSGADGFSELKKITALLAKAFNRRKFYSKPTNNNLRTSSTSQFANKKQELEGHFAKDCKKAKVKDYNYFKTKMLLAKKDNNKQVLLADDQAWMKSSVDSDQEINVNMVFMA
nr:hypothetical protein [Tanacetum cinerariifolium]